MSDLHYIAQASLTLQETQFPIITINGDGLDFLVKIHPDGSLEYGPDYTPDEAARVFWSALGNGAPRCRKCHP